MSEEREQKIEDIETSINQTLELVNSLFDEIQEINKKLTRQETIVHEHHETLRKFKMLKV